MIEAGRACKFRGHTMQLKWDIGIPSARNAGAKNMCTKCNKKVYINTNPAPNEIDIVGEAVALGCED